MEIIIFHHDLVVCPVGQPSRHNNRSMISYSDGSNTMPEEARRWGGLLPKKREPTGACRLSPFTPTCSLTP